MKMHISNTEVMFSTHISPNISQPFFLLAVRGGRIFRMWTKRFATFTFACLFCHARGEIPDVRFLVINVFGSPILANNEYSLCSQVEIFQIGPTRRGPDPGYPLHRSSNSSDNSSPANPQSVSAYHSAKLTDTWCQWVSRYSHLLTLTDTYWHLVTLTDTYWHLLILTDTYGHLRTLTDTYWHLLTLTDTYWHLLTLTVSLTDNWTHSVI